MKNKKLFAILTLVCFMFTLMPVAAFATTDVQKSYAYVNDAEVDKYEAVSVDIDLDATTDSVYVWFEKSANVPSTALIGLADKDVDYDTTVGAVNADYTMLDTDNDGIVKVVMGGETDLTVYAAFDTAGTYELHVATANPADEYAAEGTWAKAVAAIADYELQTQSGYDKVVVNADAAKTSKYVLKDVKQDNTPVVDKDGNAVVVEDGDSFEIAAAKANGIDEKRVEFTVYESIATGADVVYASDIKVEGSSKVTVNDVKVKRSGVVTFDVVAEKAGSHKVYVTIGDFNATIKVNANDGEAEEIVVAAAPQTAVNIENRTAFHGNVLFEIFDANGNELTTAPAANDGYYGAANSQTNGYYNYVSIVEQPAKSKIENKDLKLVTSEKDGNDGWTIQSAETFVEEGDYTFKVALDDGTSVKVTVTMKEAGDPVALSLSYETESVQLGAKIAPKSMGWLDANNVFTNGFKYTGNTVTGIHDDLEFVASGAAVLSVNNTDGTITVKDDEKYVGSEILVTVVDEENNLIVTKTLTVAAEAKELVFDTNSAPVDTTRTINVKLVDENGKSVGLTGVTTAEAYVVVLAKPADCDVTAEVPANGVLTATQAKMGVFNFDFSADTVGAVTVQAVLKATVDENGRNVVRYYTGTQTITVGASGIDDIVVMSIGSNEIIVNAEVKTIDAAPMISNNRTFVPFRALAEAFGATVAFDEATQAITAELDGITVVMTVGSTTYTVNGVEKDDMDVAPFIKDGRTMVPVRFAAQAFGITVTPTFDDNGATADVVFAK